VTGPGKPEDSFFHFSNPKQKKTKEKTKKSNRNSKTGI
jgi:hypothetical protein